MSSSVAVVSALAGAAAASIGWLVALQRLQRSSGSNVCRATSAKEDGAQGDGSAAGKELSMSHAPKHVSMPHPDWKPGNKQPHPFGSDTWIPYDPAAEEKASVYAMLISVVVPRPIALVSSLNKEGHGNLAPYSYFNAMGHNPPVFCIGINRSPGRNNGKKDTLMNIEETGEFVVNIMSEWYVEAANHSCGDFPTGVDEMALAGLTPMESQKVKPPRVKEAAVHMECKLRQIIDIPDPSGNAPVAIVVGEVVLFHVHEEVTMRTPTGKLVVDPVKLQPISRLGGVTYGRVTELFDLGRPNQAQMHMGPAQYTAGHKPAGAQLPSKATVGG